MLKLARQKTSAVDMVIILTELKLNLHEKKVRNLVPQQAKRILEKLEKDGEVDARFFLNRNICFYKKCESYLNVYQDSHKGVTPHLWLNSSDDLSCPPVCASAEKINCMFAKQIINIDRLFDERILVKNYDSASDRRERWQNTPISYEQKRTQLFQAFVDKNIPFQTFKNLASLYFIYLKHQHRSKQFFQL